MWRMCLSTSFVVFVFECINNKVIKHKSFTPAEMTATARVNCEGLPLVDRNDSRPIFIII